MTEKEQEQEQEQEQMHLATNYATGTFNEAVRAHSTRPKNSTANRSLRVLLSPSTRSRAAQFLLLSSFDFPQT
jgi:hypothetical protein